VAATESMMPVEPVMPVEPTMPAEPMSESVRMMESSMKSSVAKPMETVAEMPIEGIAAKPEAKASAEMPSIETVAVESVPEMEREAPGLGRGDHSE
jgi:hypothetical protein